MNVGNIYMYSTLINFVLKTINLFLKLQSEIKNIHSNLVAYNNFKTILCVY